MFLRASVLWGLENISQCLEEVSCGAGNRIRLACETGSMSAWREVGCFCQLSPRLSVVYTERAPPRLSRIFIINVPSLSSATWASVVLDLAPVPIFQLWP